MFSKYTGKTKDAVLGCVEAVKSLPLKSFIKNRNAWNTSARVTEVIGMLETCPEELRKQSECLKHVRKSYGGNRESHNVSVCLTTTFANSRMLK